MFIRPFQPADAPALAALFHASVRQGGSRDYSAAQVAAWSPAPPDPAKYICQATGRVFLVAVNEAAEPVGYGVLEPTGHIDHLYCRPDVIGTGIGEALYAELENAARKSGMRLLFTEASEAARRLFARRGFIVERRNDFIINGVAIHNYRMSKPLCPAPGVLPA
jgi:putative acetyltransferase